MTIDMTDLAVGGGVAAIDYVIGKSRFKSNSAIEIILQLLKLGIGFLIKRRNNMRFYSLAIMLSCFIGFSSCSSGGINEAKKITAQGLGEGISTYFQTPSVLCSGKAILVCSKPEIAREYFVTKTCDGLNVNCGQKSFAKSAKGAISRFACNVAVKVVMPAILPSRHMPYELRVKAGCKSTCIDDFAKDFAPKICARL